MVLRRPSDLRGISGKHFATRPSVASIGSPMRPTGHGIFVWAVPGDSFLGRMWWQRAAGRISGLPCGTGFRWALLSNGAGNWRKRQRGERHGWHQHCPAAVAARAKRSTRRRDRELRESGVSHRLVGGSSRHQPATSVSRERRRLVHPSRRSFSKASASRSP